jgi:hypothetical protein
VPARGPLLAEYVKGPAPAKILMSADEVVIYVGAPVALALVGGLIAYIRRQRRGE